MPRIVPDIRFHPAMTSAFLDLPRDVWVYVPPDYDREPDVRYPVLYMHDGNNAFYEETAFQHHPWRAGETLERMIRFGELPALIVVAVGNTVERMAEYAWTPAHYKGMLYQPKGPAYARFLVEELKPYIDRTYRTRPEASETGVLGSSMGGLISLYLARYHSDAFTRIGALSPAVTWGDRILLEHLEGLSTALRLWVDMGARESDTFPEALEDLRLLEERLLALGFTMGDNLVVVEDPQGAHNEEAWAYRLPQVLAFLYGVDGP